MAKFVKPLKAYQGYDAGHPWYYLLGGAVPTPKQTQLDAVNSDYSGYMAEEFRQIDQMSEPKRSNKLRHWQDKFKADLAKDLSIYRNVVRDLNLQRRINPIVYIPACCSDVHTSMSLKFAHLYNHFAHLELLDDLLGRQMDLFG